MGAHWPELVSQHAHRNLHRSPLLVDEELADQVQAALMAGEIDVTTAVLAWWIISNRIIE